MAAKKRADGPNRSAFIRDKLNEDPNTKLEAITEAWVNEGNEGEITPTLYYQIRKQMGLSNRRRKKRGRPAGTAGRPRRRAAETTAVAASGGDNVYDEIESTLDELIRRALELGDRKLSDDLRMARRRASAKLV